MRLLLILAAAVLAACSGGGDTSKSGTATAGAGASVVAGSGTPAANATAAPPTAIGGSASRAAMTVTITGADTFDGELAQETACIAQQIAGAKAVNVGALGADVSVNFTLTNPRAGAVPVGPPSPTNLTGPRLTGLSVKVKDRLYINGKGEATLADAEGKKGTLRADGFTVAAGASAGDITVEIGWECQA